MIQEEQALAIKENVARIRANMKDYPHADVMAVIKTRIPEEINFAVRECGITLLGENRVQELLAHYDDLDHTASLHFIGSLQKNKVKYIIDKVDMIESLDSVSLAAEIDKQAKKHGIVMDVLVEVNCGEEENKSGLLPSEVESFCLALSDFSSLRLRGFMTMAPKCEKKEDYLKYFQQTYAQVLDIWTKKLHNIGRPIISMGMSDSFEEAIACGSDIVRIGRRLFIK